MRANDLCPPKFLTASDFDEDTEVTIERFEADVEVGKDGELRTVMYLKGYSRPMVVNATNRDRSTPQLGQQLDGWVGKQITLYPTTTDFGGKEVACIRVRRS